MKKNEKKKSGQFWMFLPVLLLVSTVSGWIFMVSIATDDPGFAVERDYYKKAANYDQVLEQRRENRRLGHQVTLVRFEGGREKARLVMQVLDSGGDALQAAQVSIEAMPIARSFDVQTVTLERSGDGNFTGTLERPRTGLWELRVRVEHEGSVFTEELRSELWLSQRPPS